ncbi:OmcA/MtrC family decaheme c-type cytochrome [Teredinibacter sp. KSP-S5-2]|uniref:OmcA/MtrC family decaheme c-type cytochrome n=1 Tax=Teredinibacter sp. KSP-S5-2 TaxID=3034506 RepID=UPI002934DBD4|nr:OmcA/MtrC family decaheme c-type cytochrome [Teredinibacter sp. KSP-S5-2]WNO11002.1 OmcA/MtrC family decaheme c-type cytochrome [Teredinibacter sp. KSP-S5-2]
MAFTTLRRVNSVLFPLFLVTLFGCSGGDDGAQGPAGPQGPEGPPGQSATGTDEAETLAITVTGVEINSAPVISFTVENEKGQGFNAIGDSDLRFNLSKLIPSANGNPSQWQNYIVRASSGAMQGSQERNRTGYPWGTLTNNGDGSYVYTFGTDVTAVSCPAPCTDLDGNALDVSYQPSLTHRLTIQQGNSAIPLVNAVHDFVPSGGDVVHTREITKTENCNECHDKITVHGTRFEMQLCVTCHNPGTWNAGSDLTVDLGPMVHKIHMGEDLPSVQAGGSYVVRGHDFSNVVFPQDIRNCTKCHDGNDTATPDGNNWMTPNIAACGSCHDNIDFSLDGAVDPNGHSGGVVTDNSECSTCHAEGRIAGSVADSHIIPDKVARDYFQFNILEICGTAVDQNPVCAPGANPTMKFSVTDPSGATDHAYGNAYNIRSTSTDGEFNASGASLNMLVSWSTSDYTNAGGSGSRPSRADSVNLRTSAAVTDNMDGTFFVDGALASLTIPAGATGSGAVALEGHPAAEDESGAFSIRVPVNSEVDYFAITDTEPMPRRQVVDVPTKCDRCHDILNIHGSNRNNNGQLCVMCHNPSGTDVSRRPKDGVTGLPDAMATVDGKKEETIDFKVLIHGIHAAAESNYDGTQAHGFREKGLVVYGYGGSANDYSHVRFPGVLSKCETCHLPDTYTLDDRSEDGGGNWMLPSISGIHGSTVDSSPLAAPDGSDFSAQLTDQTDDWKYSPTVSVCSSCHDGQLAEQHMATNNGIFGGTGSNQAAQEGNVEACAVCHGPGKLADVKFVHDQAFAEFLGEFIPD